MASTESQSSDLNMPVSVTEDGESNIDTLAKGNVANEDLAVRSNEAALQKLQQTIISLEQQLDTEKKLRIKAQADLKSVVKQWKQVAQELSKQHTEAKPFHTVTDDYLKQLAEEIRYDIRCFSESYFEDLAPQPWPQEPPRTDGRSPVCVFPEGYEQCPVSPVLAQSFVWRVLKRKVFGRYEWPADRAVGRDLFGVAAFLKPISRLNEANGPSECEAVRKFQLWQATTSNMVFNAEASVNPQDRWRKFKESLIKDYINPIILAFIPPSEDGRYYDLLCQIIEKALILDREISRQAAWVLWEFEDADSHSEIVQEGLPIIAAPAMVKRGKSSGEGFEEQIELLPASTSVVQNLLTSGAYRREEDSSYPYRDDHRWYSTERPGY
ncbi:hypothetical protein F5Y09DRAFT_307086 [Xylaria sp. FL1042]|nr:hypothetical protein F5Y09DRAFT_307086 [Xylaria sp. FL1042]